MNYQYIPYMLLLFISGLITLSLGFYSFLRIKNSKGATGFGISMLLVTLWSTTNALEMSATVLSTKIFWANVQYIAYCFSPISIMVLSMQFIGLENKITRKRFMLLCLVPILTTVLVWTNQYHGLIRYDVNLDNNGAFSVISKKYGPAFYLHAIYSHFLNFTTLGLLLKTAIIRKTIYRKQVVALLVGAFMIVLPSVLFVLKLSPIKRYDITPVFFAPAGIIMAWNILRYKIFDIVPLAWAKVVEAMNTGVLVLDNKNRIIDTNPALINMLCLTKEDINSKSILVLEHIKPELYKALQQSEASHVEFSTTDCNGDEQIYEVLFTSLTDDNNNIIGRLALIYEITERKRAQQENLKQQWKLAIIEEKERASKDMHDNLGQVLGFINLQAQAIRQEYFIGPGEDFIKRIDSLVEATKEAHKEIRENINNSRGFVYLEKGFMTGLDKTVASFQYSTGIKVISDIEESIAEEIKPGIRLNILYIIKEALNNVHKHSQASQVSICLKQDENQLIVSIEDNGIGFDTGLHVNNKGNYGLSIMKERATEIGAGIYITSNHEMGSRIELKVPMWKEAD